MNKSYITKIIAVILSFAVMAVSLTSCSLFSSDTEESSTDEAEETTAEQIYYSTQATSVQKKETVYANLNSDGSVRQVTVSDHLVADSGEVYIIDVSDLSDIADSTGTVLPIYDGDNIIWHSATTDFYYTGTSDKDLPVTFNITYYLDGVEMTAEEISGQSGTVTIEIEIINNISTEITINGESVTLYNPVLVAGGMMLNYSTFTNIETSSGISLGLGTQEIIGLASIPGITESLGLDNIEITGFEDINLEGTFTLTADVTDFSVGSMYFVVVPICAVDLGIELPETLEGVVEMLESIMDMLDSLLELDSDGVLMGLLSDSSQITELTSMIEEAMTLYEDNEALLTLMEDFMTAENIEILTNFINSIDLDEISDMLDLVSNISLLSSMISGLTELAEGMEDVMPLLESLMAALEDEEVAAALENLPETIETIQTLISAFEENSELIDVLTSLLESDELSELIGVFTDLMDYTETSFTISSDDYTEELIARAYAWLEFGYNYTIYTDAADDAETSLVFICKTDSVS